MSKFNYYVSGGDEISLDWLPEGQLVKSIKEADVVIFLGGPDIDPAIYKAKRSVRTDMRSKRDDTESRDFKLANSLGKRCIGVCRGAQLLNALSGGAMFQHVDNHGRDHQIYCVDTGKIILVNSTHHQMMIPGKTSVLIAFASPSRVQDYLLDDDTIYRGHFNESEIIWNPTTDSLSIQYHPEWFRVGGAFEEARVYTKELIGKFLNNEGIFEEDSNEYATPPNKVIEEKTGLLGYLVGHDEPQRRRRGRVLRVEEDEPRVEEFEVHNGDGVVFGNLGNFEMADEAPQEEQIPEAEMRDPLQEHRDFMQRLEMERQRVMMNNPMRNNHFFIPNVRFGE